MGYNQAEKALISEIAGPMRHREAPLSKEKDHRSSDEKSQALTPHSAHTLLKALPSNPIQWRALPPLPNPSSQGGREGAWTASPGNAWVWENCVILGLFTFGIFLIFGPRKNTHMLESLPSYSLLGFFFLHLLQLFLLLGWKKNVLVISHNL